LGIVLVLKTGGCVETLWLYEAIGYTASLLVAISLMMQSVIRLRIINLIGAACFTLYGLLIQSYPVAGMNAFIVCINLYYLVQILRTRATFAGIPVAPDAPYLHAFLSYYADDLRRFFPTIPHPLTAKHDIYFIVRNAVPVGIVIAERQDTATLYIHVDYVVPGYRDFQPGHVFYSQYANAWRTSGIQRVYTMSSNKQHQSYLHRMGFAADPAEAGLYSLPVQ
jgi:hypothetical protein